MLLLEVGLILGGLRLIGKEANIFGMEKWCYIILGMDYYLIFCIIRYMSTAIKYALLLYMINMQLHSKS